MRTIFISGLLIALFACFGVVHGQSVEDTVHVPPGFVAELVYRVPENQGSWVSIEDAGEGQFITSDQYGKLYQISLSENSVDVHPLPLDLGFAQGLLVVDDVLFVVVNNPPKSGLYRVTRSHPDGSWDTVQQLMAFNGGGEHGPHAVVLSPQGDSLFVCAGNHTELPEITASRVPQVWGEDLLLPRIWDPGGHAVGKMAPGGWVCEVSFDGKDCILHSVGFRNQYDIAFNSDGELFTFDADMEWDMGTSWYRPTRILHVTSGSEFGWRGGTGKWPEYFPDSLPAVVDVGPGSPTGIAFGYQTHYPARYQNALYAADWSRGRIHAIHLKQNGASYIGEVEAFAAAAALPVTDMVVQPSDGMLYFLTGGRRLQSALHRVRYVGQREQPQETTTVAKANAVAGETHAAKLLARRQLERLHQSGAARPQEIWDQLGDDDRHVRFAARVALEHIPVKSWRALLENEQQPDRRIAATIALIRVAGEDVTLDEALAILDTLAWDQLSNAQRLDWMRAYSLAFARLGPIDEPRRKEIAESWMARFPNNNRLLDRELSRMLGYLQPAELIPALLDHVEALPTLVDRTHDLWVLTQIQQGWTSDQLTRLFDQLVLAKTGGGGKSYGGYVDAMANRLMESLDESARAALQPQMEQLAGARQVTQSLVGAEFVKDWQLDELLELSAEVDWSGRDRNAGRQAFAKANCYTCHQIGSEGGAQGPSLTTIGSRLGLRDLLTTVVEPNREISDQYANYVYELANGDVLTGRVMNLGDDSVFIGTDLYNPGRWTKVKVDDIESKTRSDVSAMPTGLMNVLDREEILDLLAFLQAQNGS